MNNQGIGVRSVHVHNKAAFILEAWLSWGPSESSKEKASNGAVAEWNKLGSEGVGIPEGRNFKTNVHAIGGITHHVEENEFFYEQASDKVLEVKVTGTTLIFELITST